MAGRPRFLCGVVEGFYGRPWSMEQRKLLFEWLRRWGLNCYMYAPKDELKHRLLWREPYTEHETAHMRSLIVAAQEHGVEFVFAISTGQDMVFSSAGDRLLLQQKLRQVAAMGCQAFALLFDDIDPCMCQADRDTFPSLAQAQASVANEVYQELGQPPVFLFCPTEYCSSLCSPSPSQSCYLLTIGRELLPGIGVIWTGPKVVSQELSAVLLEEAEGVLRRQPIIWDNLYANDYDCRRVFLGPYTGRAPGLMARLHGLLLNPNCELQANFIPIHTLGSWFRSELWSCAHPDHTGGCLPSACRGVALPGGVGLPSLVSSSSLGMEPAAARRDSQGPQDGSYSPQEALELALRDWVAEINRQALEPGARSLGHTSVSLKGGAQLGPGTAGWDVLPDHRPHGSVPGGTDQHRPEACGTAPGEGRRKVTFEPKQDSGSMTHASGQQNPAGDRDQPYVRTTESCEPTSAMPSAAQTSQSTGAPVATETIHSPGPPTCCSDGTSTAQNLLPTSDARMGGGSSHQPCSSTQPEPSRADMPQTPPGPGAAASPVPTAPLIDGAGASPGPTVPLIDGAGASPVPTAPLIDGAGASPGPTAPLIDGAGANPVPTAPLIDGAGASPGPTVPLIDGAGVGPGPTAPLIDGAGASPVPTAPLIDGAGASPVSTAPLIDGAGASPVSTAPLIDGAGASPGPTASLTPEEARSSPKTLLIMEETESGPMVALIPMEARSSPTSPLTVEEPRSSRTAPLTPEEPRSSPTAPLTLEEPRSSRMAPLTPEEPRSSPTSPLTVEEPRSSCTAPLTPEELRSSPTAPLTLEEPRSSPMAPLTPEEPRSSPTAPLTLGEVRMLVELFYLPYHHGPLAQHLLEHFRWLRANSLSVGVSATTPDAGVGQCWRGRAQSFTQLCAQTCFLHTRLVGAAGQALLYDLHPYLWDIRNVLLAASAFVQWLDGHLCEPGPRSTWGSCFGWCQSITAPILLQGDAEPWAQRGGLFGELQALLPVGNSSDLFYQPPPLFPSCQLYVLRPLQPRDKGELYRMCWESLDCDPKVTEILVAHPDLLGDRLLGSFLSLSPEYTFVLEDEAGPCGYAAGVLCAEGFLQQRDSGWLPAMRHKYPRDLAAGTPVLGQDVLEEALLFFHTEPAAVPLPVLRRFPSLVQLGTAARMLDAGASRSLALCLLSALRANGSRGVFCQVSATDQQQLSFYSKLGFVALPLTGDSCPGARLLGRLL